MTGGILRCCTPRRVFYSSVFTAETRNISHTPAEYNTTGINEDSRKWHIYSAVCVERHPLIQAKMTEMEKKAYDLFKQITLENSMISDHELRLEREAAMMSTTQQKTKDSDMDIQKAVDLEDIWKEELNNFTFPPTYDDTKFQSLDRKLDRNLLLLIKQNLGKKTLFLPPQVAINQEETMRDAAERCLKTLCGPDFKAQIYGNSPFGFLKYSYPKRIRETGYHGAKVFYFLAKYLNGHIPEQTFQWVDREELAHALPNVISKRLFKFLLPE